MYFFYGKERGYFSNYIRNMHQETVLCNGSILTRVGVYGVSFTLSRVGLVLGPCWLKARWIGIKLSGTWIIKVELWAMPRLSNLRSSYFGAMPGLTSTWHDMT